MEAIYVSKKASDSNKAFLKWALANAKSTWPEFKTINAEIKKVMKDAGVTRFPAVKVGSGWVDGMDAVIDALENAHNKKPKQARGPAPPSRFDAVKNALAGMTSSGKGSVTFKDNDSTGSKKPVQHAKLPKNSSAITQVAELPIEGEAGYSALSAKGRKDPISEKEMEIRSEMAMRAESAPAVMATNANTAVAAVDDYQDKKALASMHADVAVNMGDYASELEGKDMMLGQSMNHDSVFGAAGSMGGLSGADVSVFGGSAFSSEF